MRNVQASPKEKTFEANGKLAEQAHALPCLHSSRHALETSLPCLELVPWKRRSPSRVAADQGSRHTCRAMKEKGCLMGGWVPGGKEVISTAPSSLLLTIALCKATVCFGGSICQSDIGEKKKNIHLKGIEARECSFELKVRSCFWGVP